MPVVGTVLSAADSRLWTLIDAKLQELNRTSTYLLLSFGLNRAVFCCYLPVVLRRTDGLSAALSVVLSDEGKSTLDKIRIVMAQIQDRAEVCCRVPCFVADDHA